MNLAKRGAYYFGEGNVARCQCVKLGRYRVAFVSDSRLWIYEEEFGSRGMVINLTPTMRNDLLAALGVEVAA